ncbi:MAG: ATP-dependent DNA helicase RecG [bacterium]|nr:ATP-dependent DNA helicase RecG [bacterium]
MLDLDISISALPGVGPKIKEKLERVGLRQISDLLFYFPRKWEDYRNFTPIAWCRRDEEVTIKGIIIKVEKERTRLRNMMIVKARVQDETGEINAVWFNQGFMERMVRANQKVTLHGKVDFDWKNKERVLASPILVKEEKIVPVYSEGAGISSKIYEKIIKSALAVADNLEEWLPDEVKEEHDLINLAEAIKQIHHPSSFEALNAAKLRLAFDELFLIALSMAEARAELKKEKGLPVKIDEELLKKFTSKLPYILTDAQRKATWEIIKDVERGRPMNRLVEGDVGSGKTVVGTMAALAVINNGYQVAWMAPTEILARQHYKNVADMLNFFGIKIALVTGNLKEDYTDADMIIGTHALIQDNMVYKNLGLVIVDEQHRFGVAQRSKLRNKQHEDRMPHLLSMTATPIPRTLALALYGDLEISIINQMPEGRQKVKTQVVSPTDRQKAYDFIKAEILKGRQAFVICPLIESSNSKIPDGQIDLFEVERKSAVKEFEKLSKNVFPDLSIGLLHGRMKAKEKELIMNDFSKGKINILVATAVVEVGIDIPNATVMMIEGAERFGLAQLHQFRGRVGRGKSQAYCLLFSESWSDTTKLRLQALVESNDGFELAERDLQLRGPGELAGIRQSGLPDLKMASLTDTILIKKARVSAERLIARGLNRYPLLNKKLDEFEHSRHLE